jgi:hypothetical protein
MAGSSSQLLDEKTLLLALEIKHKMSSYVQTARAFFTAARPVKEFQEFCGTRKFQNILVSVLNQINAVYDHPISSMFTYILSSYLFLYLVPFP